MTDQCLGICEDGTRCERVTNDVSGYCGTHKKDVEEMDILQTQKCKECSLRNTCPAKDRGPNDRCYYEVKDNLKRLRTSKETIELMKNVISSMELLRGRLVRLASSSDLHDEDGNYDDSLPKRIQALSSAEIDAIRKYSDLRGWSIQGSSEDIKEYTKLMRAMLSYQDKETSEEDEVENVVVVSIDGDESIMDKVKSHVNEESMKPKKIIRVDVDNDEQGSDE